MSFTPRATHSKKAAAIQPITAWFTSSSYEKHEAINAGSIAALLVIKKRDKVTPISLISPSADRADAYKIQASDDLSLSSPAYISKWESSNFICGIMEKGTASEYGFLFIDSDLRDGLPNHTDASKAALTFTHLPEEFPPDKAAAIAADHVNKDLVPVLVLLPVAVPVGYGKPAPSGSLAGEETQTMLQAIADPFKAWADSALYMINQHEGKSLHRVHGLTPMQFGEHVPGSDADKTKWIMALTNNIFSVIEIMTIDDLEYSDQ